MRISFGVVALSLAIFASACGSKGPTSPSVPGQVARSAITWSVKDGLTVVAQTGMVGVTVPRSGNYEFEIYIDLPREAGHMTHLTLVNGLQEDKQTVKEAVSDGKNYRIQIGFMLSGKPGDYTIKTDVVDRSPAGESVTTQLNLAVKLM